MYGIITWGELMITEKDIKRIGTLAKLEIDENDIPLYIKEMQDMLDFAEGVGGLGLQNEAADVEAVDFNMLRSDKVLPSASSNDILSNAKDREEDYFLLRKQA